MRRSTADQLTSGFTGRLELYAVDWDSVALIDEKRRSETITVGNQTVNLLANFTQGDWISLQVTQAAGSTLAITDHPGRRIQRRPLRHIPQLSGLLNGPRPSLLTMNGRAVTSRAAVSGSSAYLRSG